MITKRNIVFSLIIAGLFSTSVFALEVGNNLILDPLGNISTTWTTQQVSSGTVTPEQKQQVIQKMQEEASKYPFFVDKDDEKDFRGKFLYHQLYVNDSMILYQFRTEGIAQQFLDQNNAVIFAQPMWRVETKAVFSYFVGDESQRKSGLPSYSYLSFGNVYPSIEMLLRNQDGFLQKIIYVKPGGDTKNIRLKIDGDAIKLTRKANGSLEIKPWVSFSPPTAIQYVNGQIHYVTISYEVIDDKTFSFLIDAYDTSYPLVITYL